MIIIYLLLLFITTETFLAVCSRLTEFYRSNKKSKFMENLIEDFLRFIKQVDHFGDSTNLNANKDDDINNSSNSESTNNGNFTHNTTNNNNANNTQSRNDDNIINDDESGATHKPAKASRYETKSNEMSNQNLNLFILQSSIVAKTAPIHVTEETPFNKNDPANNRPS
ncbi:hypothetical protein HELRODRAFT_166948 [Helobdella robusta]|uniref:Uncharacterized protein n=1 Tax=Helobdella robusta TaxID=6412 RepID=T1EYS9_HELRO|nr:hypothetical protein HELRODRAFT_166948 [Helobdella robusta]ESO11871.1 hypothetical protein HELRODRAFT_166948 [Helobdella robusta]